MISVIVPVFNAEKTLYTCISSLKEQTFTDLEIILVNDGSTDSSMKVCDELVRKDTRISVYHVENGGPARARNIGLEHASGEYIGFVDADDFVSKHMYQTLFKAAQKDNADIVLCSYCEINGKNKRDIKHNFGEQKYTGAEIKDKLLSQFYCSDIVGLSSLWNKLYRKSFLDEHALRMDEALIRAEDYWFNFEALMQARCVSTIEDVLYYYQDNPQSIMHKVRENQFENWVKNRKKLLKYNESLGFELDRQQFYYRFVYNVSVYLLELAKCKNNDKIKEILNDEFYLRAVKQVSKLPVHIAIANCFLRLNIKPMTIMIYKCWALAGR